MRIDGTSGRSRISGRGKASAKKGAGSSFRPAVTPAPAPAGGVAPVLQAGGIDAILALQGVDGAGEGRRKALRHGHNMLDTLEEMKADLLAGRIGEGRLNRLMALVSRAREQSDPEVDRLVDEIDLLARVQLAKLGHYVI